MANKICPECNQYFDPLHHLRKYCHDCRPPIRGKRDPSIFDDRAFCQYERCKKKIPKSRGARAKYCTSEHGQKQADLNRARKVKTENAAKSLFKSPDTSTYVPQERQGIVFELLKNDPLTLEALLAGKVTASSVAVSMDVSTAAVTRAMQAILSERAIEAQRAEWTQSWRVQAMLPKEHMSELKVLGMAGLHESERFNELLDHCIRAYATFSRWYFKLEGRRPLVKEFHLNWIRSIIVAWATGGKQLILSPPRHGKSEMLVRFVVWFICMDPNIRIGWFCASRDVAELMLGAVKDYLENSEQLIDDILPPGELFNPGLKSGRPWSRKEIKVAQCNHVGQKSSTLLALGLTSKFLSRDMDLIVIDDPEDFDSTQEEAQRKKARNKLAEIGTRKEEHTAMAFISSRQHPDDIPAHLLALEGTNQAWNAIVDSAHDDGCGEDPFDYAAHADCMLFPEVRSYRWLMEKKEEMEVLGVPHAFSMRYLNHPIPEEGQVFDVPLIREVALNRDRGLGLDGLPLGHLVGGLDPSARGIQAAFCWHYREDDANKAIPMKMSMVDLDAMRAGGVAGAVDIICDWYDQYALSLWFYETNSQQIEFYKLVKEGVAKRMEHKLGHNPIQIREHSTGQNKQDAELGISSMAPIYHSGQIDLPYGTNESRIKVNMLLRQLELWTSDGVQSRKSLTDIKMAQWFPWVGRIQKFLKDKRAVALEVEGQASYPEVESFAQAPWATNYPGG